LPSYERLYSDLQRKYEKLQGEFTDYLAAEEYSPRVKKLERHYGSAERQRTQVAREYQALQNKYTQLERKTAKLEEQLLGLAAKDGQVRLGGDDRLLRWLIQLDDGISALLSSRRWEIGNTVAGAIRAVTRRKPQGPTAEDHIKNVLREFRSWSKKS
jgi:chromosome segregation ATPase